MISGRAYRTAGIAALMLIVMCGQGFGPSLKAIDDKNRDIELRARPRRIISLAPRTPNCSTPWDSKKRSSA